MSRLSTVNRPPGVYVIDERPLSRPMTQASLGGCAMICQLTIPEPGWKFDKNTFDADKRILQLNSFDDFVSLLGGNSFIAELAIKSGFQLGGDGKFVSGLPAKPNAVAGGGKADKVALASKVKDAADKLKTAANAVSTAEAALVAAQKGVDDAKKDVESKEKLVATAEAELAKATEAQKEQRSAALSTARENLEQGLAAAFTKRMERDRLGNQLEKVKAEQGSASKELDEAENKQKQADEPVREAGDPFAHLEMLLTEIRDDAQVRMAKKDARLRLTTGRLDTARKAKEGYEEIPAGLEWLFKKGADGKLTPLTTDANGIAPPAPATDFALTPDNLGPIALAYWSIFGFFANGGDKLFVVDVPFTKTQEALDGDLLKECLRKDKYDFGLICAPGHGLDVQKKLVEFCGLRDTDPVNSGGEPFCFAVLDAKAGADARSKDAVIIDHNRDDFGSTSAAMYWPWLKVTDTRRPKKMAPDAPFAARPIVMPPSGFIAGLICGTDSAEGPHRAPAGMDKPVRGCQNLSIPLGDVLAGELNEAGVNCLREFTPGVPVSFGCRTLSSDPNYKYVPVSRVLMSVRKTVKQQLRWAVHRPNTGSLRKSIKRDIEALLERMRRQGQLAGEKPEQAYKVEVSENRDDQRAGILKVRVEVAPTYPAEFIIVEVAQMTNS